MTTVRTCTLTEEQRKDAIMKQIWSSKSNSAGPREIKKRLASEEDIHISRDEVTRIMKQIDFLGMIRKSPTSPTGRSP